MQLELGMQVGMHAEDDEPTLVVQLWFGDRTLTANLWLQRRESSQRATGRGASAESAPPLDGKPVVESVS
jgi:hypothetical protein